ncbi:hypothetical protein [Persephonella sp.]|nr:hypothetical protein [Aquificota bacterium]
MCEKDIIFCAFYYFGFIAIGGGFLAGWFIFSDYKKYREELEERDEKGD